MNHFDERGIHELLTPDDRPTPPPDLAARIKAEIPQDVACPPASRDRAAVRQPWQRPSWLLAASLATVIGGVWLASRTLETPPSLADSVARVADAAPAPTPPVELAPDVAASQGAKPEPGRQRAAAGKLEQERKQYEVKEAALASTLENRLQRATKPPSPPARVAPSSTPPSSTPPASNEVTTTSQTSLLLAERKRMMKDALSKPVPQPVLPQPSGNRSKAKKVPTSRDPWAVLTTVPGVQSDRINVGGAESGQQSTFVGAGAQNAAGAGEVEGVKITDMGAIGSSPSYQRFEVPAASQEAMRFQDYGTHSFVATEVDARSTFALDVDTGSYNLVRRYLNDGGLPPASAIRVEEMINRFDYGYAPPEDDDFALHAEGAPVHFVDDPRRYLLRFGIQGREVADGYRPPADLVFVVDVSGSMARGGRLELVRQALRLLVDQLTPADRVALVVYGTRGRVVLPLVANHDAIRHALEQLRSSGSTNAEEGLRLGFELALVGRRAGTISRVILCSDGVANVGRTDTEGILSMIHHATSAGIELTTVGFGMGNYNDVLMEQLADQGNGRYAYVDDLDEARRIFVESLTGTLLTIAAEAKAQVVFNPEVVARYRLIGYENRDIADKDFRNDAVDAGEIGAGHAVTALYEVDLQPQVIVGPGWADWVAVLHLRWGSIALGEMTERELRVTGEDFALGWDGASTSFRWSALVARLGEQLRGVYGPHGIPLATLHEEAERLSPELFDNPDFVEFRALVAKAAKLDPTLP